MIIWIYNKSIIGKLMDTDIKQWLEYRNYN